jgi:hypothetical protein
VAVSSAFHPGGGWTAVQPALRAPQKLVTAAGKVGRIEAEVASHSWTDAWTVGKQSDPMMATRNDP